MSRSRRNGRGRTDGISLRLLDFSDRDLLQTVAELGDNDGWVEIGEVATRLFGLRREEDHEVEVHARRCVAIRFSWMKRYGVLERARDEGGVWRLSAAGEAIRRGTLRAAQANAVEGALDEQLLHLATAVGERYAAAGPVAATMVRRSFQYATGRRR